MASESKRKFSDLLKQAAPVGLREAPPEPEPETKRLRTTSPELHSTGQSGFVVDQGSDEQTTQDDASSSQHTVVAVESVPNGVSASSRAEGVAASAMPPSYEPSATSEPPSESTVSPVHLSGGQSEFSLPPSHPTYPPIVVSSSPAEGVATSTVPLCQSSSATSEPPSESTVSPDRHSASQSDSSMTPLPTRPIVAEEDEDEDEGPEFLDDPNQNRKRVLSEFNCDKPSNDKGKAKASAKKARVSGWDHIRTFVRPTSVQKQRSALPEASTSKPRLIDGPYPFPFVYPSPLSNTSQTLYAHSVLGNTIASFRSPSPSALNASALTEPSQSPDFFYASDADDDVHEADNIKHARLPSPVPAPSMPSTCHSNDDSTPDHTTAMDVDVHLVPENDHGEPVALPRRPPRVHIEEVIDEDYRMDQNRSTAPSSNFTYAQPSNAPSASPSNTSHIQASSATSSSHPPKRPPRVHVEEVVDEDHNLNQNQPSAPSSNSQASSATPSGHPPSAPPSNAQASSATPSGHLPSAPPSNMSHTQATNDAQATNVTASRHSSKRKPMPLYVDVEDDDPIITSDLTELDDNLDGRPTESGPSHGNDDADAIIREEIKHLISTEVRTRHMQTKFLQLLNGPNPDLTKIMCMILLHLRPVRSLDPTGVILGGAISEKPDDQSPDLKASLPKRKQYHKTKHRPTSRVTLQASVRAETKELLNSTLVEGNLVSVDPRIIEKWERGTHRGPTVESFYLELEGKKEATKKGAGTWTPWNKRATEVFVAYFCSLDGFQNCKPDIVARTFRAHLLNLREKYLAQNSDPLDPQRQDQERYERRLARRNRLLKVRVEAFQGIHSEIAALEKLAEAIILLTAEAMSGDETAGEDRFFITKVAWRSKELENFLAHLSALHLCGRYIGNGKYQRGAFPRARERSSRPESIYERDAAPKGYPSNWYDHTWLHAHPMRLASVQPTEPVPLCLPSAVMNQAKRFLSVKTRKDKPLPLNNV
ncbi:hypothetical protein EV360DRAFT_84661 [Lentinula raphanica]|nr:hypothetical protein EV360DRAFT_84661 [Lentinula raphanica]